MAKTRLFEVPLDHLALCWPEVQRIFERDPGVVEVAGLYHQLQLGERQLWLAYDGGSHHPYVGVIITAWVAPGTLLLHLAAGSGLSRWLPAAVERLNKYTRWLALTELRVYTRKGWISWATAFRGLDFARTTFHRDRPTARGAPRKNAISPEIGASVCRSLMPTTNRVMTGSRAR